MPNIKSSKRSVKTEAKRRESNTKVKAVMKTAIKKVSKEPTQTNVADSMKKIDKALKKGIIKKNTAARKKALISKKANKAE